MRRLPVPFVTILLAGLALPLSGLSCRGDDPPGLSPSASIAPLASDVSVATRPSAPRASTSSATSAPASVAGPAQAPAPVGSQTVLLDEGALPQTKDRPRADSPQFQKRMQLLWEAIVSDDPKRAVPAFFPKGAYLQVKDIPDPATDWERRLIRAFERDIHRLHKRLADRLADAKFLGVTVPDEKHSWMPPGKELNKIGYHRTTGAKIRYEQGGRERAIDLTSLISWRGEWFVVHVTGFK